MAADRRFADLLATNTDDVEKPKPLPAGIFDATVKGFKLDINKNGNTFVKFEYSNINAGPDVPPEDLEGLDLSKRLLTFNFYLTDGAKWRLKEHLQSLGISTTGKTFGELLPLTVGSAVRLEVIQYNSQDGKEILSRVESVVGVD